MINRLLIFFTSFYYSLSVQLLIIHLKRNHFILAGWVLFFFMILGEVGKFLGIPYLFLDPAYLNKVNFLSFFIVGITLANFNIVFNISTYILTAYRFSFIGSYPKPFLQFSINNSLIPLIFLFVYLVKMVQYQLNYEYHTLFDIIILILGLIFGYFIFLIVLYLIFWFTNKEIFKYMICKLDKKIKSNIRVTRSSVINKLNVAKKSEIRVDNFINLKLRKEFVGENKNFYDKEMILKVFDQNHFNLIIVQFFILLAVVLMTVFKDQDVFQLPAASTIILIFTIFLMIISALYYWFGEWSATIFVSIFVCFNIFSKSEYFNKPHKAFGINYDNQTNVKSNIISDNYQDSIVNQDIKSTTTILNNWKSKCHRSNLPKMVFVCVSGGGQRSAIWVLNSLQEIHRQTDGEFLKHTMLITGSSGGMIGASYFRELFMLRQNKIIDSEVDEELINSMENDNLNAIIISMLTNFFVSGIDDYEFGGFTYEKDLGYSFEEQINKNTNKLLDKKLTDYQQPEFLSEIPMMIITPTIINNGRRLYISSQYTSYMSNDYNQMDKSYKPGIEFLRFFDKNSSKNLRFLSALRMNATFPFVTPIVELPSNPSIKVMDAGLIDNFGIADALQFIYTFKNWIEHNTSGIIMVSIRDSKKNIQLKNNTEQSFFERVSLPVTSIIQNFESIQDNINDQKISLLKSCFDKPFDVINIEYSLQQGEDISLENDTIINVHSDRASLSWRLTSKEIKSIIDNIHKKENQQNINKIKMLLQE